MASCVVDGCQQGRHAHGMCKLHYNRMRRYGRTDRVRMADDGSGCSVPGCSSPYHAGGYCTTHYMRIQRTGILGDAELIPQARRNSKYRDVVCAVDGCVRHAKSLGWCEMHYQRQLATGDPGEAEPRKMRGQSKGWSSGGGYRMVSVDGRRIMEHHLVMKQLLGREIAPFENVHHLNGVRDDNRPENLELWVKPQPNGQRVVDLVAWVVAVYPDEVRQALEAAR